MALKQCILPYVKQIASPGSMHETEHSGLVHWDDPEGWDTEGGGRRVQDEATCTPMADSCQCMTKTTAAATAAKSLQSCPTVCDPIDCNPPGSPVPGILQARTLKCVAIFFSSA